jgi:hypothetical protein
MECARILIGVDVIKSKNTVIRPQRGGQRRTTTALKGRSPARIGKVLEKYEYKSPSPSSISYGLIKKTPEGNVYFSVEENKNGEPVVNVNAENSAVRFDFVVRASQEDLERQLREWERRVRVEKLLGEITRTAVRETLERIQKRAYVPKHTEAIETKKKTAIIPPSNLLELNTKNNTSGRNEGKLLRSKKKTFPALSAADIEAVLERGTTQPWSTRTERGFAYHTDVFEYVRDTYGNWIPGLTQELLFQADSSIESSYKTKKSKNGLPQWLFIPAGAEARELLEPDSRRTAWRQVERERHRKRRASLRSFGPSN